MKMLMNKVETENTGTNNGVYVGQNSGTITFTMQESTKIPSLVAPIIKTLGCLCIEDIDGFSNYTLELFKPDNKIEYNNIIKYKDIIKENSSYFTICDDELNIYDNSNMGSKSKILRWVKNCYLLHKGKLLLELKDIEGSDIQKIKDNSDLLIDAVIQTMRESVNQSSLYKELSFEELDLGITCFTCYCFMKCKILEKPE